MNNPFATLGLDPQFDIDKAQLEERYRSLQKTLHPDRHRGGSPAERRLSLLKAMEVNDAYRQLRDESSRAAALLALHGVTAEEAQADPAFLMEVMELREALSEARAARDGAAVERLAGQVKSERQRTCEQLASGFRALHQDSADAVAVQLQSTLGQLRYYQRFLDEVRAIEDDLGA